MGSQPSIARLAVEAEPGSHCADGVESGEGAIYVIQDSQHPRRVQRNEHDGPVPSAMCSRTCRSAAARLEGKARSPGGFTSNMKTVLSSCMTSNVTMKIAESRDWGQYWGTRVTVNLVSTGKTV